MAKLRGTKSNFRQLAGCTGNRLMPNRRADYLTS
jgi:hypothetical protein